MLCVFHRERTSEVQATYRRCFSIPVESILLLLGSSNEGIVVHRSPIFTVAPLQVHRSPISSVAPSTSIATINTVAPSTSAPFTNLQCYAFYKGCTHRHCCASTVAPFCSIAPFVSYHFVPVIMLLNNSILSNNLATNVNTPCRQFNCIIEIKVLATTEQVATCRCIYSTVVIQLH